MPRKRNRKKTEAEEKPEPTMEDKKEAPKSKYACLKKFHWTKTKENALLESMIKLKPAGVHKHSSMLLIRERFSEKINEQVPTNAIWEYIQYHWDTDMADIVESPVVPIVNKDFELPKTEEWSKLIDEEYEAILKANDAKKDINRAEISNVDLKRWKSVKVMVEKLDIHSLLINCYKSNTILNCEDTLKNGLNNFQIEHSSSNASIGVKRKLSCSADVDADINLLESGTKYQSPTDMLLIKKSKSRSISSDKHSITKKKRCIDSSDVTKNIIPIFDKSSCSSSILECSYFDSKVNNIKSNTVVKSKLPISSQSISSFNLSASKDLSKFEMSDLKDSKKLTLKNTLTSKSLLNSRRKFYGLRNQSKTTKNISSELDNSSRSLRSKIKDFPSAS